jgi:hypothetical protein
LFGLEKIPTAFLEEGSVAIAKLELYRK